MKEYYIVHKTKLGDLHFYITWFDRLPHSIQHNQETYINTKKSWYNNYYFDNRTLADTFYDELCNKGEN
jgi:hypothetical protein